MRSSAMALCALLLLPAALAGSTFSGSSEVQGLCVAPFACFAHLDVIATGEPCAPSCTYTAYDHAYSEHFLPHDLWVQRDEYLPLATGGFQLVGTDVFGYDRATLGPNETFLGFWHEATQWQFTPTTGGCQWFGDLARTTAPSPLSTSVILETPRVHWKVCLGSGETIVSPWSGP